MAGFVGDEATARATEGTLSAIQSALAPYRVGAYPNFVEDPADASSFFDPATWRRLREIRALYDPGELFKANHAIPAR